MERKSPAGMGAQYDSELVYHHVRGRVWPPRAWYTRTWKRPRRGECAPMVRKHFMKLVRPNDHKFAALPEPSGRGAPFVYVPSGISVANAPLQSYFQLNAPGSRDRVEHTLIIVDEAPICILSKAPRPKYEMANLHAGCVGWSRAKSQAPLFHH